MKQILLIVIFLLVGLGWASAQASSTPAKPSSAPAASRAPQIEKRADLPRNGTALNGRAGWPQLSDDEIAGAEKVIARYREKIATDRAEIEILRAQITKLLLPAQPDLEQIKQLIKKSLEYEGNIRIAEIERQIDLRKLFGDNRWILFSQRLRNLRGQLKDLDGADMRGRELRLFTILRNLTQ